MKDRFVLAILASIAMHLLLIEMVIALEHLWSPARQANEPDAIPVELLEVESPAHPSMPSPRDGSRPVKNVRPGLVDPYKEFAKLAASPGGSTSPAKAIPPPVVDPICAAPTDRPLPEAENSPEADAAPVAAIAVTPADTSHPAGLMPPQDPGRGETATGPGDAVAGAGGGSSRGDAAGGGGQGSGKAGAGAVLVPGEFLAGNPPPRYPLIARRKGWEGTVVIDIQVSGDGRVRAARIEKSSSYTVLDDAALGAVRNWRIAPSGCSDGTDRKFRVPVVFRLTQM